jgi:hypothetical protein
MMDSLFIKYGIMAGASEQTATPTTATVTNNYNSVTFRITNTDTSTASVVWQIRQGTNTGTLRNSGTLSLGSGNNNTVSVSTSQCTTYVLTNVIATAAGKDPSEKGIDRSLTTPSASNGTLLSSFCSGDSLVGTYANGSCGTYTSTISSCSTDCGCDPCAGCPSYGTYIGQTCSGCDLRNMYADGCCGVAYTTLAQSNSTTCCAPPDPCAGCTSLNTVLSDTCDQFFTRTICRADGCCGQNCVSEDNSAFCGYTPPVTCSSLAGQDCSYCLSCNYYLASYTGGGTYPNCTCQYYDVNIGACC